MQLLLTSAGLTNPNIAAGLRDLTGTEPKDTKVAYIPVAADPLSGTKDWLDMHYRRFRQYGYRYDVVNIAGLTSEMSRRRLEAADVIVNGAGHAHYLSYWMDKSGLFDMLPELLQKRVYVGLSAGSMIMGQSLIVSTQALPRIERLNEEDLAALGPPDRSAARTARLVNFLIRPHLNSPQFPKVTEERLAEAAKLVDWPIYAIEDRTAIQVVDGKVQIINEEGCRIYENRSGPA